jgi:flagellar P-ring protein precursor FlgI
VSIAKAVFRASHQVGKASMDAGCVKSKEAERRTMNRMTRHMLSLLVVLVALIWVNEAGATTARIGDVTHLQGQGTNTIVGHGLVVGLDGTGDGEDYLSTMRALNEVLKRYGTDVPTLADLGGTANVAIVMVTAQIPPTGAREGEQLDLFVTAQAANSLKGGRLLPTPLIYHTEDLGMELFAMASGTIEISADSPNAGKIVGGARMERDVFINVLARGYELPNADAGESFVQADSTYVTLVIDDHHAGWPMAVAIAQAIDHKMALNADVERVALAIDPKNVLVLVPEHQRNNPATWIRDIERIKFLVEPNEARVTINRGAGTIVVSGDTRISPVIVSQRGMTITVFTPLPDGTVPRPAVEQQDFVAVEMEETPTSNVQDLLEALNQLKVPFEERLSILEQIHKAGKLHARLVYE